MVIFKPKSQIWVIFGGSCNGKCWSILQPFVIFYGHLVYFMDTWYILWTFSIFCSNLFSFWYVVPRKIWQPCLQVHILRYLYVEKSTTFFLKLFTTGNHTKSGLPDFSCDNIPERKIIYTKRPQNIAKWPQNISNNHKIYQLATK
jgi:hypothetical protein